MNLAEKYRPANWAQVLGQDKVLKQIDTLRARGLGGRAFWISGASGTGKTTIAKLLAAEIAAPEYIMELDAGDITIAALRDIERVIQQYGGLFGGGKPGRGILVNESHGLRRDAVRQLLVLLERLPSHVLIVFTTTNEGQTTFEGLDDASPLLSRCIEFKLTNQGLSKVFAARALEIARAENLDGQELPVYETLVKKCRNNFRAVLQEIEKGAMIP